MKIAFILILFSSSVIGVFADSDELKSVSVMEGDSVTLHTGVTEIQGSDSIEWRLNGIRMVIIKSDSRPEMSFRGTIKLNNTTGDLKITNVRPTDSGLYKLNKKGRELSEMTFSVTVVISSGVKSASVMEGDSVTLNTGVNELQTDDVIRWRHQNILVAGIDNNDVQRYRDKLELDNKTGSLTITNTRTEDAGVYEVEISRSSRYTIHKSFSVNVNERKSVSVMEGDSVNLISGLHEIQRDNVIRWSFGKTVIAKIIKADQRFPTDDDVPEGRFRGRLKLDHWTGSLTIPNTRNTDSGEYEVEIISSRFTIHKRINVTVNEIEKLVLMEGDSVTLHTGATKISSDVAVLWFGGEGACITPLPGYIDQNDRNGDLTIRNIQRNQSGDYKVHFINSTSRNIHRIFHINISGVFNDETGGVKTVSVIKGNPVFLNTSVTEIQKSDLIEWLFGPQNIIIAKTDEKNNSTYNEKDVRFKNRLNLDNQTGDLTIKNSDSEDSGRYQLKIINNNTYTIQKSFSVTVHSGLSTAVPDSGLPPAVSDPGLSPGAVAGIVFAVVVLLLVIEAAVGVIYYCLRSSKPERSSEVNGQNHTSDKDEETELTKPAKAVEQQ